MLEFVTATKQDKADIIDLANYVFSHDHCPHDFKTLLPKSYSDEVDGLGGTHYVAREDGKLKAMMACRPATVKVLNDALEIGLVGNVCVHPYERGRGLMQTLMHNLMDDARANGMDMLVLGGQRQRYAYYGYEKAGYAFQYSINRANLLHGFIGTDTAGITFVDLKKGDTASVAFANALVEKQAMYMVRPAQEFVDIVHSWTSPCRMIYKNGAPIGFMVGNLDEVQLVDENDYGSVVRAAFDTFGYDSVNVNVAPFDKGRAEYLLHNAENCTLVPKKQILVFNFARVITVLGNLCASIRHLNDLDTVVTFGEETLHIVVKDGKVNVEKAEPSADTPKYSVNEAEMKMFSLQYFDDDTFGNLFPLPFFFHRADAY